MFNFFNQLDKSRSKAIYYLLSPPESSLRLYCYKKSRFLRLRLLLWEEKISSYVMYLHNTLYIGLLLGTVLHSALTYSSFSLCCVANCRQTWVSRWSSKSYESIPMMHHSHLTACQLLFGYLSSIFRPAKYGCISMSLPGFLLKPLISSIDKWRRHWQWIRPSNLPPK